MTTELNKIFAAPHQVTVGDKVIKITPFKLGELPRVFKTIDPISKLILDAIGSNAGQLESLSKIMVHGGENVIDLIALGTRQERQWVEQLEMDQAVTLIAAVLEVNASFFGQKVLPVLTQAMKTAPTGQV